MKEIKRTQLKYVSLEDSLKLHVIDFNRFSQIILNVLLSTIVTLALLFCEALVYKIAFNLTLIHNDVFFLSIGYVQYLIVLYTTFKLNIKY